nr:hypothetical protein [Rhizobium leguminosarum]
MKLGRDVRSMPPSYVKPFVRRGAKNDAADAAAICGLSIAASRTRISAYVATHHPAFAFEHQFGADAAADLEIRLPGPVEQDGGFALGAGVKQLGTANPSEPVRAEIWYLFLNNRRQAAHLAIEVAYKEVFGDRIFEVRRLLIFKMLQLRF